MLLVESHRRQCFVNQRQRRKQNACPQLWICCPIGVLARTGAAVHRTLCSTCAWCPPAASARVGSVLAADLELKGVGIYIYGYSTEYTVYTVQ